MRSSHVLLALALAMGGWALVERFGGGTQIDAATGLPSPEVLMRWAASGRRMGPTDASVQVIEFGNFTCGSCKALHEVPSNARIRFLDQISVVWLNFVERADGLGGIARDMSMAAECAADQGRFERAHDLFFAGMALLGTRRELAAVASVSGVQDSIAFEVCMDQRMHGLKIDAQSNEAHRSGFPGTPTWFVNGRPFVGAPTQAEFDAMVIAILRSRPSKAR